MKENAKIEKLFLMGLVGMCLITAWAEGRNTERALYWLK